MINNFKKLKLKGNYIDLIKGILKISYSGHHINDELLKASHKAIMPAISTTFQQFTGNPSDYN